MKTCISFIIIFSCFYFPALAQEDNTQIIATVGNYNISLSQFNERYSNYLISSGSRDNYPIRKAILNNIINEIILYYYDSNENILNSHEYKKELDEARIRTILAFLKDQEIYAKISVNEEEMREAFVRVNEKVAARHLFAQTEDEANNLYELVKIGVDFETLAKQVFTDSILQNNGGYLGYFTWGDMDPVFEEAAYSLKVGEISAPVKTAHGYSIIKLEDKVSNPLLTEYEFLKKKSHLENVLKIRKKNPYELEYINKVFDKSRLSFNNKSLDKILSNLYNNRNEIESDNFKTPESECVYYKDKVYSQVEIEQNISELPYYHRDRINSIESLKAAIEGMLLKEVLYNIAVNKGYDTTEAVQEMYDKYKKSVFLKFKKDDITKNGYIPDSTAFNYYKANINSFSSKPELNLQEILVSTKELADSILMLLSSGNDFGELAKKYSLRKWSAENNGILGYSPLPMYGNYSNLFWETQVDEIIGPVKIENTFGIFKVLGKTENQPIDFNLIKNEVIKEVQFEKQTEILRDYINSLRKKVNIKINDNLLSIYEVAG